MRYLILLSLTFILALSQTPYCKTKAGKSLEKVYLYPQETQAFSMADFFEGFNLYYHAKASEKTYQLIQSMEVTSKIDYQDIDTGYQLIDFDVQSDENGAWMNRASSLGISDAAIIIRYGPLTDKLNADLTDSVKLDLDAGSVHCFDIATLNEGKDALDCYDFDTKQDFIYIFNHEDKTLTPFNFENTIFTSQRKTIPYHISGNRTYLLSATLAKGAGTKSNQTIVRIYSFDQGSTVSKTKQLNAATFGLDKLAISDLTVDALGNIYITDLHGNIIQFTFDGENAQVIRKQNLKTPLFKVSVYIAPNLAQRVQVVTENSILEYDLDDQTMSYTYQLPAGAGNDTISFQTNEDLLIVQTTKFYYIYERYQTNIDRMVNLYKNDGTLFALSPRSPHIIIISPNSSSSLLSSKGFLLVNNQDTNQTITITAASQNPDGQNPTCVAQFLVTSIKQGNNVYIKKDFNDSQTSENPAYQHYRLDQYFLGSRLTYSFEASNGTTINLQYISTIAIQSDTTSMSDVDWFSTFSYDISAYYRLYVKGNQMTIQDCVYDGEAVSCKTTRTREFTDKVFHQAFFKTTLDKRSNTPFFVYTTESDKHNLRIIQLDSDKNYAPLEVNSQFNITDIDANERFLYATVRDAHVIYVFKNDFQSYVVDFVIDATFVPAETIFYPRETILSPNDINVLIVLNLNSILIFRITAFSHEYISSISLPQLQSAGAQCKVSVARDSMLVFIKILGKPDEILEYGIYNVYTPILMRTIELGDKSFDNVLQISGINDGNIVAVKTVDRNNNIFFTLIRAGQPKAGSILTDVSDSRITNNTLVSLVSLADSAILQFYGKSNPGQKSNLLHENSVADTSYITGRYYFRPLLIVRAEVTQGFKNTFAFTLKVNNVPYTKALTVYNVRSKITTSNKDHELVNLPNNANSDQPQITQIYPDALFVGPVSQYKISCPVCEESIKLWDHVYGIGTSDALTGVKAYNFFENAKRLWALTNSKIHITDASSNYISNIGFDFAKDGIVAENWYVDGNNNIRILFTNGTVDNQFIVEVIPADDKGSATLRAPINLEKNPGVGNALVIKSLGSRIFIHDASLTDTTNNKVHVYTLTNNGASIVYETTIDSTAFGAVGNNGINDFELIPTDNNKAHFFSTLGSVGFAWFSFDKGDVMFEILNPNTYNATNEPKIINNLISADNNFLQFQIYSVEKNGGIIKFSTILTVDNGQHFQLSIELKEDDQGVAFTNLNVVTTFGKYGKEKVLNWMRKVDFRDHAQNLFLIAHQGTNNVISLSVYDLLYSNSQDIQQMMGAIVYAANSPVNNNLAAHLFRDANDLKAVASVRNDAYPGTLYYNLSKEVYLSYKYDEIKEDFSNIDITASNNYGQYQRMIPVKVDRPDNKGGLAWYIIVGIAVGGLVVVGLVVFIVIKQKRKRAAKDSLLSTSKNESDDDV